METLLQTWSTETCKRHSRSSKIKNKDYEKKQKQINILTGALNKYQSEIENTVNTEINELKMKI
jgi:hypothetical protein